MYDLREYQKRAVSDIQDFISTKRKKKPSIAVLPTGAGKSIVIAEAVVRTNVNTVVLQPNVKLLTQNSSKYMNYGFDCSIFSASAKSKEVGKVTFATPKSVINALDKFKRFDFGLIMIDEAHLGTRSGSEIKKIAQELGTENVVGLTATPVQLHSTMEHGSELIMMPYLRGGLFKEIVHLTQIRELTGYWTPVKYLQSRSDYSMLRARNASEFKEETLKKFFDSNNMEKKIADAIRFLKNEKGIGKALIFVPSVEKAKEIASWRKDFAYIDANVKESERKDILNRFENGDINYVVNLNILSVGYDYPNLCAIIDAYPTNSAPVYIQRDGRLRRVFEGKEVAYYVDLGGNYERFGDVANIEYVQQGGRWVMKTEKGVLTYRRIFNENNYDLSNVIFNFGKYKGLSLEQVAYEDMPYVRWVRDEFTPRDENQLLIKNRIKDVY